MAIRPLALSKIARDRSVAQFFERGERDSGPQPVFAKPRRPQDLSGGSVVRPIFDRSAEQIDARTALAVHLGRSNFSARILEDA